MNLNNVTIEKTENSITITHAGYSFENDKPIFWVAEIIDTHPKYKVNRDFISKKNTATISEDGYYQIFSRGEKFTFKFSNGEMIEMTEDAIIDEIKETKKIEIKSLPIAYRPTLRSYYKEVERYHKNVNPGRKKAIENHLGLEAQSMKEFFSFEPKFPHKKYRKFEFIASRKI